MANMQFTSVDRILAKLERELRGTEISETDVIEWVGEALGFLEMPEIQEQSVAFIKVSNYEADMPRGFQAILQVAKYDKQEEEIQCYVDLPEIDVDEVDFSTPECCSGEGLVDMILGNLDTSIRPYFDMQFRYETWTVAPYYKQHFTPIRLAESTYFNSVVCEEKDMYYPPCGGEEYTIVGTTEKKLRFSFKEGYIALAYYKNALDKETGYPLIPDNVRHLTAINYYIRWKVAEMLSWNSREGFAKLAETNERHWLKYVKQAKNWTKMPKTVDDLQNILENTHHFLPRVNRYYSNFGHIKSNKIY